MWVCMYVCVCVCVQQFSELLPKTIPPYDWAMFDKVKELKKTVEDANVGELSSHMKGN